MYIPFSCNDSLITNNKLFIVPEIIGDAVWSHLTTDDDHIIAIAITIKSLNHLLLQYLSNGLMSVCCFPAVVDLLKHTFEFFLFFSEHKVESHLYYAQCYADIIVLEELCKLVWVEDRHANVLPEKKMAQSYVSSDSHVKVPSSNVSSDIHFNLRKEKTLSFDSLANLPQEMEKTLVFTLNDNVPQEIEKTTAFDNVPQEMEKTTVFTSNDNVPQEMEKTTAFTSNDNVPQEMEKTPVFTSNDNVPQEMEKTTVFTSNDTVPQETKKTPEGDNHTCDYLGEENNAAGDLDGIIYSIVPEIHPDIQNLLCQSQLLYDAFYYSEMECILTECLQLCTIPQETALVSFGIGLACYEQKKYEEAIQHLQESEGKLQECYRLDPDPTHLSEISYCRVYMGEVEIAQSHYSAAVDHFHVALKTHQSHVPVIQKCFQLPELSLSAKTLKLALALRCNNQVADSERYYRKALLCDDATLIPEDMSVLSKLSQGCCYGDIVCLASSEDENESYQTRPIYKSLWFSEVHVDKYLKLSCTDYFIEFHALIKAMYYNARRASFCFYECYFLFLRCYYFFG